jgi:hypothetical protein
MKATIDTVEQETHSGKDGIFKKKPRYIIWSVIAKIQLSEEEKAIVNSRRLGETVIYVQKFEPEHFSNMDPEMTKYLGHVREVGVTINDATGKDDWTTIFYNPISAKNFAQELETEILPNIKALINAVKEPTKTRTIEL